MSRSYSGLQPSPETAWCESPKAPSSESSDPLAEVEKRMQDAALAVSADLTSEMAVEHLSTGGKRFRARLVIDAADALGAPRQAAIGWAAAVELLHNATLVHDDIQDGDRVRRGKATVWARYGVEQAINAGDFLLMLPYLVVTELPVEPSLKASLTRVLAQSAVACVRGQVSELQLKSLEFVPWPRYLEAVRGKTGALLAMAIEGSALLAGRSSSEAADIAACFLPLGELFQMQDDVLDLYGEKGRSEPASDIYEGKISALVVAHLVRYPGDTRWLRALLDAPRYATSSKDAQEAVQRIRVGGALADVLDHISTIERKTRDSSVLEREPALKKTALELCQLALKPIAHLTDVSLAHDDSKKLPKGLRPC